MHFILFCYVEYSTFLGKGIFPSPYFIVVCAVLLPCDNFLYGFCFNWLSKIRELRQSHQLAQLFCFDWPAEREISGKS